MQSWRHLLFELNGDGTESFVKGGLPLAEVKATRVLSGPHQITGKLTAANPDLTDANGAPLLKRWKSTIYVEDSNRQIWIGGVVADYSIDGPDVSIDVTGFTTAIKDEPYDAEFKAVQIDPMVVVREFWGHYQSRLGGNLGLTIDHVSTPVRIGEPPESVTITPSEISRAAQDIAERLVSTQEVGNDLLWEGAPDHVKTHAPTFLADFTGNRNPLDRLAMFAHLGPWTTIPQKLKAAQEIRDRLRGGLHINPDWGWPEASTDVFWHRGFLLSSYGGAYNDTVAAVAWLDNYIEQNLGQTASSPPNNVLRYNWWSTDDMGGVIDQLAKDTPFDYLEHHTWDGTTIKHRLEIGYPRIGNRLNGDTAPRFVLGENVVVVPSEEYDGEDVVTEVWVLGAGEGRAKIRGMASVAPRDSIRRVKQIDAPEIQTMEEARRRAQDELAFYQPDTPGAGVTALVVSNHSNAEFGTYNVGDEIMYSANSDWGKVAIWVRILTMTINPEDSDNVTLTVARADTLKT